MSTEIIVVGLLLAAVAAFVVYQLYIKKPGDRKAKLQGTCPQGYISTTAPGICLPTKFQVQELSQIDRPDGGYILLEIGTGDAAIRERISSTILAGTQQTIDAIRHHRPFWTNKLTTTPYQFILIRKMATNQDGTPALLVGGIQSAGTVINVYADLVGRGDTII